MCIHSSYKVGLIIYGLIYWFSAFTALGTTYKVPVISQSTPGPQTSLVNAFLGIPYAADMATSGQSKGTAFIQPKLRNPGKPCGPVFSPACLQRESQYNASLTSPVGISSDCRFLNIFAPQVRHFQST